MEWIPITEKEPPKEFNTDVYTQCTCGTKGKGVVEDAVYYHHEKRFFHNQDTAHTSPIPATHWLILKPPR